MGRESDISRSDAAKYNQYPSCMYVAPNLMYVRVQRLFSETDRERGTSCVVVETDSSEGDSGALGQ